MIMLIIQFNIGFSSFYGLMLRHLVPNSAYIKGREELSD